MRIIIDADACPRKIKNICTKIALKYNLELIMVIDDSHKLMGKFKIIQVSTSKNAVDLEIVKISSKEDIVITQDYGLASMVINKSFATLHPNGTIYNNNNLESLMFQKYIGDKVRREGGKIKGFFKKPKKEKISFEETLIKTIEEYLINNKTME